MNGGAMLNAYPDSLGGTLSDIAQLLESEAFADAFRSFYILPSVFNTDLDRGFSVISYDLNRMLAAPEDVKRLKEKQPKKQRLTRLRQTQRRQSRRNWKQRKPARQRKRLRL